MFKIIVWLRKCCQSSVLRWRLFAIWLRWVDILWRCWCLQYSQLGRLAVGPISYAEDEDGGLLPLVLCKSLYSRGSVAPSEETYDIDAQLERGEHFHIRTSNTSNKNGHTKTLFKYKYYCFFSKVKLSKVIKFEFNQNVEEYVWKFNQCDVTPTLAYRINYTGKE